MRVFFSDLVSFVLSLILLISPPLLSLSLSQSVLPLILLFFVCFVVVVVVVVVVVCVLGGGGAGGRGGYLI